MQNRRFGANLGYLPPEMAIAGPENLNVNSPEGRYSDATFMWDREQQLSLSTFEREPENVFYYFFSRLSGHLNRSILRLGDVSTAYGASSIEGVEHTC